MILLYLLVVLVIGVLVYRYSSAPPTPPIQLIPEFYTTVSDIKADTVVLRDNGSKYTNEYTPLLLEYTSRNDNVVVTKTEFALPFTLTDLKTATLYDYKIRIAKGDNTLTSTGSFTTLPVGFDPNTECKFSEWGQCTIPCGGGSRYRTLLNPENVKFCEQFSREDCNMQACPPVFATVVSEVGPDYAIVDSDIFTTTNVEKYTSLELEYNTTKVYPTQLPYRITNLVNDTNYNYTVKITNPLDNTFISSSGSFQTKSVTPNFDFVVALKYVPIPNTSETTADLTIQLLSIAGGTSNISAILLNVTHSNGTSLYNDLNITNSIVNNQYTFNAPSNKIYNIIVKISNKKGEQYVKSVDINTNKTTLTGDTSISMSNPPFINVMFPNSSNVVQTDGTKSYIVEIRREGNTIRSIPISVATDPVVNWKYNISDIPYVSGYEVWVSGYDIEAIRIGTFDNSDLSLYNYKWIETDCSCESVSSSFVGYTRGEYKCYKENTAVDENICSNITSVKYTKTDKSRDMCGEFASKCVSPDIVLSSTDISTTKIRYGNSQFIKYFVNSSVPVPFKVKSITLANIENFAYEINNDERGTTTGKTIVVDNPSQNYYNFELMIMVDRTGVVENYLDGKIVDPYNCTITIVR